jgi:hypothetical protein
MPLAPALVAAAVSAALSSAVLAAAPASAAGEGAAPASTPAGPATTASTGVEVAAVSLRDPLAVRRTAPTPDSASLEQCVSSPEQEQRSATFSGEMSPVAGSVRMEMRIDVLEKAPEEETYRRITAPGLGVWRASAPGVKSYRYLKQVTNLAAPASYRGAVRFRWLNAHGRQIAFAELRTRACEQTVVSPPSTPSGATLN